MWIDRSDFRDELERRIKSGAINADMCQALVEFERDGYIVLPGAASTQQLDRFESAISQAFREGHRDLIAQLHGSGQPRRVTRDMDRASTRIVDSFAVMPESLDLLSSPRLIDFLRCVLDDVPMLFQSLSFHVGSQQGLHQDTAYVVVDRPIELVACWIALEDVLPGSGELQYLVGSHRLPDYDFGEKKHWDPVADGGAKHDAWFRWILSEGDQRQLPLRKFMAKRGDILVWHADLAHGGSPITNPELTRKSLVGHYCPANALPHYMKLMPARRTIIRRNGIAYGSGHYDLAALTSDEARSRFLENLFGDTST